MLEPLVTIKEILRLLQRLNFKCRVYVMYIGMCVYSLLYGKKMLLYNFQTYAKWIGAGRVLVFLGARVGEKTNIDPCIIIQNAEKGHCDQLEIGDHTYIGPGCLFDLAGKIQIGCDVALAARTNIITHADVGDRPLQAIYPRKVGDVVVGDGAWIGVGAVILQGVTIGEMSVVGAMSLVKHDIPPYTVSYGVPCRVVREIEGCMGGRK